MVDRKSHGSNGKGEKKRNGGRKEGKREKEGRKRKTTAQFKGSNVAPSITSPWILGKCRSLPVFTSYFTEKRKICIRYHGPQSHWLTTTTTTTTTNSVPHHSETTWKSQYVTRFLHCKLTDTVNWSMDKLERIILLVFTKGSCDHKIPLNRHGMSSNMAAPYKTLFIIFVLLKFLNYSYFTKIMTRKPKLGDLANMTKIYPFPESK